METYVCLQGGRGDRKFGKSCLRSLWMVPKWLNSVVGRNRDGMFPIEWQSHKRGKGNFSMNHERHIIFSPRMA